MPYFIGFYNFLAKSLNWAAACVTLVLLYTLIHESIEERTRMTSGETGASEAPYRRAIIFENRNFAFNNGTILKNNSVHQVNIDRTPAIIDNAGHDYSSDEMFFSDSEENRLEGRPRVPGDVLLLSSHQVKFENKSASKIVSDSQPENEKFTPRRGARAETLRRQIRDDSKFAKVSSRGETNKDPYLTDSSFHSANFSSTREGLEELNRTYVSQGSEEQDTELLTNVIQRFDINGELYTAEEAKTSERNDTTSKSGAILNSNASQMIDIVYNHKAVVKSHIYPVSKRDTIRDLKENRKEFIRRLLSQPVSKLSGAIDEFSDQTNEEEPPLMQVFKGSKKLESQVENTTQELPSEKVLLSVSIANSNVGGAKMGTSLINKVPAAERKRASSLSSLLRESEAGAFQGDEDRTFSGSTRADIGGNELLTTPCEVNEDCTLHNYDDAPHNDLLVRPATCNNSSGTGNGTCTCGDFCVSRSRDYDTSHVYFYCGPCGRLGSSCKSNLDCTQTNVYCSNSYCSCSKGGFYDLYYCVYNFTGYEKALQVAISICIGVAILLLVVTICGARHRARGGGELSPYLMRLLLRRANEGTRESPPGDIPPSYEDIIAADRDELPSYDDAVKADEQPTDLLDSLPSAEQEGLPASALISLAGEVNYGFQMDEEVKKGTENASEENCNGNLLPIDAAKQLRREWGMQISDESPPDVRISVEEVNEGFEDDEFDHIYDLPANEQRNEGPNDNGLSANFAPYVPMDPSTGAIPKNRNREMNEHLNKLKRGPNRRQPKNKGIQKDLILQDPSSYISSEVYPTNNEANENNILESDTNLGRQAKKPQNSLSNLETWTPTPTDGQRRNNGDISELAQLNNVFASSSALKDTKRNKPQSYEIDLLANDTFPQNSHGDYENSRL